MLLLVIPFPTIFLNFGPITIARGNYGLIGSLFICSFDAVQGKVYQRFIQRVDNICEGECKDNHLVIFLGKYCLFTLFHVCLSTLIV